MVFNRNPVARNDCFRLHHWIALNCAIIADKEANKLSRNFAEFRATELLFHLKINNLKCDLQRNWVFATNSNVLILISLQPVGVNFWKFKLFWSYIIYSLKYLMSTTLGCKDKGLENQKLWQRLNSSMIQEWKYFKIFTQPTTLLTN